MRFPPQSALTPLKQTPLWRVLVLMSIPVLLISCGLVAVAAQLQNSQRSVVQKDFRIFDYYRGSQRPKALLHGREAEYLRTPIPIRRMTIETYLESGLTNLTATAESCYADRVNRTAYSADPLRFQLGDGRFILEGVGFHWNQTNSVLIISNRVKSVIRGDLMQLDIPRP
jgi:hypothetical protein